MPERPHNGAEDLLRGVHDAHQTTMRRSAERSHRPMVRHCRLDKEW
jgi:hypothetical protein